LVKEEQFKGNCRLDSINGIG